jgi:hypothetical protein
MKKHHMITPLALTALADCGGETKTPQPQTNRTSAPVVTSNTGEQENNGLLTVDAVSEAARYKISKEEEAAEAGLKEALSIVPVKEGEGLKFQVGTTSEELAKRDAELERWMTGAEIQGVMITPNGIKKFSSKNGKTSFEKDDTSSAIQPILTLEEKTAVDTNYPKLLDAVKKYSEAVSTYLDDSRNKEKANMARIAFEKAEADFEPSRKLFNKQLVTVKQALLGQLRRALDLVPGKGNEAALDHLAEPLEPTRRK